MCSSYSRFFVMIISARMFSIPHIAGGGRLCLERHWPRDRRRHDSWRRLQTSKAKPPGNMEVLVDWLENLMYLLEAETKQPWKIYICWLTQNDTKYDKAYQYAGCMDLFFWPRRVQQDLLAELWSFACWSCKWGRRTDGALLEMVWPLAFIVLKQKRNVVFC